MTESPSEDINLLTSEAIRRQEDDLLKAMCLLAEAFPEAHACALQSCKVWANVQALWHSSCKPQQASVSLQ